MKIKYIVLLSLIVILLSFDSIENRKKISIKTLLIKLSKTKIFKLNNQKKYYKKLKKDLKGAGLRISPELFNVIRAYLIIVSICIVIIISYLNKFNMLLNIKELKAVAETLGTPDIAEIKFNLNLNMLYFTILIVMFLPRIILKLIIMFKSTLEEKEIPLLQTYTLMLIKANKPVKSVLECLMSRSKMFYDILNTAYKNYTIKPDLALLNARESTANEGFEKIIRALEQNINNDKETSLIFLDSNRRYMKELKSLNKFKKNTQKIILGTFFLGLPLLAFFTILGYPIFNYALSMINGY